MQDQMQTLVIPRWLPSLTIVEEAQKSAAAMMERMRPFFEDAQEISRRIERYYEPIARTVARFQEAAIPALETALAHYRVSTEFAWSHSTELFVAPVYYAEPTYSCLDPRTVETPSTVPIVNLPNNARWDDGKLEARFKDPHTLTVLYSGKLVGNYGYCDLGFARENTKGREFDKQWKLLTQLAIISEYRMSSRIVPTPQVMAVHLNASPEAVYKIKSSLSKKLQVAFGISGHPFHPYDSGTGYRLKFALRPEAHLRGNGELHRSGGELLENEMGDDIMSA